MTRDNQFSNRALTAAGCSIVNMWPHCGKIASSAPAMAAASSRERSAGVN
jgi:hypothetical protein